MTRRDNVARCKKKKSLYIFAHFYRRIDIFLTQLGVVVLTNATHTEVNNAFVGIFSAVD